MNGYTGEILPALCGRLHCRVCVRAEAFRFARAIGVVRPTQMILLTGGAEDWPTIQDNLNRFRGEVRKRVRTYQDVAHVERNPSGEGTHLHLPAWGDRLDEGTVRDCASRAGFGPVAGVKSIWTPSGVPIYYGVKVVIDGSPDGPELPEDTQDYLNLNGGRLGHATKGFWRDGPDRPVKGWRAAAARAR